MGNFRNALSKCKYRIDYVGNLYGAKWKEELPFLETCKEALEYTSEHMGKELTSDEKKVIGKAFKDLYKMELEKLGDIFPDLKELFTKLDLLKEKSDEDESM